MNNCDSNPTSSNNGANSYVNTPPPPLYQTSQQPNPQWNSNNQNLYSIPPPAYSTIKPLETPIQIPENARIMHQATIYTIPQNSQMQTGPYQIGQGVSPARNTVFSNNYNRKRRTVMLTMTFLFFIPLIVFLITMFALNAW